MTAVSMQGFFLLKKYLPVSFSRSLNGWCQGEIECIDSLHFECIYDFFH